MTKPVAATASAVARRRRLTSGRGTASTPTVTASRMAQRPSGPILLQPATVKIVIAMATSTAPAPSSSLAAVRPDISGRCRCTAGVAARGASRSAGPAGPGSGSADIAGICRRSLVRSSSNWARRLISQVLAVSTRVSSVSIQRISAACGPASQMPQDGHVGTPVPIGLTQPGQCTPEVRGALTAVLMLSTVPVGAARDNRRATQCSGPAYLGRH